MIDDLVALDKNETFCFQLAEGPDRYLWWVRKRIQKMGLKQHYNTMYGERQDMITRHIYEVVERNFVKQMKLRSCYLKN